MFIILKTEYEGKQCQGSWRHVEIIKIIIIHFRISDELFENYFALDIGE